MVTPATMVHMKPSRNLNLFQKKTIMDNSRVNHGLVDSFRMFKEYVKGYRNVGASLEDFKNFSRDVKKYIKEYDAEMLLETFMQKKAMSPSFYFDFDVDDEKRLSKVFWADPISIKNYALFGKSSLLMLLITSMNIKWCFVRSLAMGDCYPTTIITDQCKGINQAVKDVFGDKTQHRLCMWHIMKKLPDKVGPTICQNTNFLKEINSIVWDGEIDTQEFELRWKSILSSYELSDHEWMKSMFDIRSSWIPAYFRDIYLGGSMRTTSRSESENSFFGNFTNPHLTLVEFWMRFQSAMDAQRWKYAKMFERIGLLCKHVLWVLKGRGFDDILMKYLLDRWGKYATCRPIFNVVGTTLLADCMSIENHQSKISELWSEVFTSVSLVEDNEELGDELLELLTRN
ncbi:protein FAR-RED IMPAIRED RESPONSE 1-like [Silene latifolia]|uniref:protein FAR-RED IMPAIRED RESPONSE 1-like n=1 Tax=Silene latifolia TaxID=37657 RepID=UPI003D76E741